MVRVVCCLLLTGLPEPSIHKPCDFAPFLFPENRANRKNAIASKVTELAEGTLDCWWLNNLLLANKPLLRKGREYEKDDNISCYSNALSRLW